MNLSHLIKEARIRSMARNVAPLIVLQMQKRIEDILKEKSPNVKIEQDQIPFVSAIFAKELIEKSNLDKQEKEIYIDEINSLIIKENETFNLIKELEK